ncbi:MAG: AIR synthase-related protein [Desulforegulaceae bacterium]|nr:AIR synthase-related protein [Desulforegulaceae bacterium]
MIYKLETALKSSLKDPQGESLRKKAREYFNLELEKVRTINVLLFDLPISEKEFEFVSKEIFFNPVSEIYSFSQIEEEFDFCINIGFRPGVCDNPGKTAVEAISDILSKKFPKEYGVYSGKRYCIKGKNLSNEQVELIAGELLANETIQSWKVYSKDFVSKNGFPEDLVPKAVLNHQPEVKEIIFSTDDELNKISDERNLALNPNDVPVIREYFFDEKVISKRKGLGLSNPTDLELEFIAQARSDHCNHNTFQGKFLYTDKDTGEKFEIDNLFKVCIKDPTIKLKNELDWVVSVLWDNAGAAVFDENYNYTITGETHNSPSNMEAYGGAMTGILGIFRDIMGTGLGSKLIMGSYGFCTGLRDYNGELKPKLHPRRLLDGAIEGAKEGGNKSGVPTTFGQVYFDNRYIGKCLVYVTALGLMPKEVNGKPCHEKTTSPGELIVICGGRVGKDGIHGVTASSETFSESTPAGHVQIGDPYSQKKMHDFLLEARDLGLMTFITDNGGGGLSSSIGESARLSNGCVVDLEKVPLKYEGLDPWEIWISESQERMTAAVKKENIDKFLSLSAKHEVESTIVGEYTDSGMLHVKWNNKTIAYVDIDLPEKGFPQWNFEAEWSSPKSRGMNEPVITPPSDYNLLGLKLLSSPNICSKKWITRQYDHEAQGTSVIKPLTGVNKNIPSDASVIRPNLKTDKGLVFTQAINPGYSDIDTDNMTRLVVDEAFRRLVVTGADPFKIGGVDNFCWPGISFDEKTNPDGKLKAAKLVRSCLALKDICLEYKVPLLSGKDSMYVDGHLKGPYGETRKVSAPESLQFSASGVIDDCKKAITSGFKFSGDKIYLLGKTFDELGGSEFYSLLNEKGVNIPFVNQKTNLEIYKKYYDSNTKGLINSGKSLGNGGLFTALAFSSMAGGFGVQIELDKVLADEKLEDFKTLFSESSGRILASVSEENASKFEEIIGKSNCCEIGFVRKDKNFIVNSAGNQIINLNVDDLESAFEKRFGDLI